MTQAPTPADKHLGESGSKRGKITTHLWLTCIHSSQAVFRFVDGTSRGNSSSSILSHFDRSPNRPLGLVKQAYSAYVSTSPTSRPRKWHLTAYFTYADLQNLPTIDCDPKLKSITVPPGVYRSGKARSRNSDLIVDTSLQHSLPSSSASSSSSSISPHTPRALMSPDMDPVTMPTMHATRHGHQDPATTPRILPPLHAAVPQDGMLSRPKAPSPLCEQRCSEDQRIIQILNSRIGR